jgi:branched-chain amino acid transport system substrate-binding protein
MKRRQVVSMLGGLALPWSTLALAEIPGNDLKIGVLADMSGPYAGVSGVGSVVAAKMAAADYVKHTGSKLKVEVLSADHQNKPDLGSSIARKWYDSEGVEALFDVTTSSVALAVNQITKEKNKVLVDTGAGTPDLTGKACTPNTIHWLYDTWELAHTVGSAVVKNGGTSWFFLTADYKFGHDLRDDTAAVVKAAGGKVLGSVNIPLGTQDYSSFLLQAQGSKAKILGLANAGADTTNAIKQAAEFGIVKGGQKMAGLLVFISDVHGLGLQAAQGLQVSDGFYWDMNDATRAWTKEYVKARNDGNYPNSNHAAVYAGVYHYLQAVDKLQQAKDGAKVVAEMKKLPVTDKLFQNSKIRVDGRVTHDVYLFEVKSPSESKYPWDYYKKLSTIPGDQAFRPLDQGGCYLVKEEKS